MCHHSKLYTISPYFDTFLPLLLKGDAILASARCTMFNCACLLSTSTKNRENQLRSGAFNDWGDTVFTLTPQVKLWNNA